MNTLGKSITQLFYISETGFQDIESFWKKEIANGFKPTTYDLISYAIIRGKDYRKGFTPITNSIKLANGHSAYASLTAALIKFNYRGPSPTFTSFLKPETVFKDFLPATIAELQEAAYKVAE